MIAIPNHTNHDIFRILVVDDEVALCEILAEILRAPGRSVEVCDHPQAALKFLEHNPIDLAFIDANMPGMTGLELAERIKERYPQAHIVICSGYLGAEIASQALAVNVDRVLQKPVDFGELIELAENYASE